MNKSFKFVALLLMLLLMFLLFWFFIFKKETDFYRLKDIEVRTVVLYKNRIYNVGNEEIKNYDRLGLSVTLKKEFISGTDSKRTLLSGSKEVGLKGIHEKIKYISIKITDKNELFNGKLNSFNCLNENENELGSDLYNLYEKKINFDKFVNDIRKNEIYTRGISFDNYEIYFWFNKGLEKDILQRRQNLILIYEIDNNKVVKKIN